MIHILIGADICPTTCNYSEFEEGNAIALVGSELKAALDSADYRIFNLEGPLTDDYVPIKKAGPNLIIPTKCINGIKNLPVDFLTLANNHILDQGEQGLDSTTRILNEAGINHSGTGKNLSEAAKPFIAEVSGKNGEKIKLGIYCCAEHEFTIANENKAGANPYDAFYSFDAVQNLKETCDFVMVLYHGGREYYRWPSPCLQKTFRRFAERGADLVIAQHTHCIGCRENYKGAELVYGQGNFLFIDGHDEFLDSGVLVSLGLERTDGRINVHIRYIPIVVKENVIRIAGGAEKDSILHDFERRSNDILQPGYVEEHYKEYVRTQIAHYITTAHGHRTFFQKVVGKLERSLLHKDNSVKRFYKTDREKLGLLNFIECEPHREILIAGLKDLLGI